MFQPLGADAAAVMRRWLVDEWKACCLGFDVGLVFVPYTGAVLDRPHNSTAFFSRSCLYHLMLEGRWNYSKPDEGSKLMGWLGGFRDALAPFVARGDPDHQNIVHSYRNYVAEPVPLQQADG